MRVRKDKVLEEVDDGQLGIYSDNKYNIRK